MLLNTTKFEESYLERSVSRYMSSGKSHWYLFWMIDAWAGVILMYYWNDNTYALTDYNGTNPNIGLVVWTWFGGPLWSWVCWIIFWYDSGVHV